MTNLEKRRKNYLIWQLVGTTKEYKINKNLVVDLPQILMSTLLHNSYPWSKEVEVFMPRTLRTLTSWEIKILMVKIRSKWSKEIHLILRNISPETRVFNIINHNRRLRKHSLRTPRRWKIKTRWLARKDGLLWNRRRVELTSKCTWARIAKTQIQNECLVNHKS